MCSPEWFCARRIECVAPATSCIKIDGLASSRAPRFAAVEREPSGTEGT